MGIPPVRGVIQSAAVLQDRTLDSMTHDDFLLASQVKVEGTVALERAFGSPQLDFFLMLSSAVNITGASGQANYNAGNAVQDAIAQHHRGSSCNFMLLSIGWIEDAIATADDKARLSGLRRAGLRPIRHDELSCYLDYALGVATRQSCPTQAIIGFDKTSLSQNTAHNGNARSAMFCHIYDAPLSEENSLALPVSLTFTEVVASGSIDSMTDFVAGAIIGKLSQLTSADAGRINERHGSILAVGLDSLVAIELRNWVMREFDAPLQSSEIMTDQTVRTLAEKVVARSRVLVATPVENTANGVENSEKDLDESDNTSPSYAATSRDASTSAGNSVVELPRIPFPTLEDTLRTFEESRRAIDSDSVQHSTSDAVRSFLEGQGPLLQRRLEETEPDVLADAYDRQVYLERRDPLQDYSLYSVGHPVNAPAQPQWSVLLC
ncbi:KR domain-containing protein [Xylariaceae sp. FL1272]|nr:KR domain-containing protein [Xylariaceae sp. FL1272]